MHTENTRIDLSGRTALVTGGAVGIGAAIVTALADAGAEVAFTYLNHPPESTRAAVGATGRSCMALQLDATVDGMAAEVVDMVASVFGGRIDILVNNVGGLIDRVELAQMSDEHWRRVIDTNLGSAFSCTRAALTHMPHGGRIVNISSLAAQNGGGRGASAYAASKAGLDGLTRALAKELGPRGITVNAIAPGLILETPFHATFTPIEEQIAASTASPLARAGTPSDVAAAVLYLASSLGSFVTGAVLDVNGGTSFRS